MLGDLEPGGEIDIAQAEQLAARAHIPDPPQLLDATNASQRQVNTLSLKLTDALSRLPTLAALKPLDSYWAQIFQDEIARLMEALDRLESEKRELDARILEGDTEISVEEEAPPSAEVDGPEHDDAQLSLDDAANVIEPSDQESPDTNGGLEGAEEPSEGTETANSEADLQPPVGDDTPSNTRSNTCRQGRPPTRERQTPPYERCFSPPDFLKRKSKSLTESAPGGADIDPNKEQTSTQPTIGDFETEPSSRPILDSGLVASERPLVSGSPKRAYKHAEKVAGKTRDPQTQAIVIAEAGEDDIAEIPEADGRPVVLSETTDSARRNWVPWVLIGVIALLAAAFGYSQFSDSSEPVAPNVAETRS